MGNVFGPLLDRTSRVAIIEKQTHNDTLWRVYAFLGYVREFNLWYASFDARSLVVRFSFSTNYKEDYKTLI